MPQPQRTGLPPLGFNSPDDAKALSEKHLILDGLLERDAEKCARFSAKISL
jgi:hypothetical protein